MALNHGLDLFHLGKRAYPAFPVMSIKRKDSEFEEKSLEDLSRSIFDQCFTLYVLRDFWSQTWPCCDTFRIKLATYRYDWFFTARHISHKQIALSTTTDLQFLLKKPSSWTCLNHLFSSRTILIHACCHASLLNFGYVMSNDLTLPKSYSPWHQSKKHNNRALKPSLFKN